MSGKGYDLISSHPAIWLTFYGFGCALTSAVVANVFGGAAGGMTAGFLALAGALGYEVLSRWDAEETLQKKVSSLYLSQTVLSEELEKIQENIDGIHQTPVSQTTQPSKPSVSSERRPSAAKMPKTPTPAFPSPRNYADLALRTIRKRAANTETPSELAEPAPQEAPKFSDAVISELVHLAAQNDRIETFAQPIVKLPSRRLAYIELFARIRARAGVYLAAGQYRDMAEREALIANIDHLLLLQVFEQVRSDLRRGVNIGYFLNISADTLTNARYVSDLIDFVRRNPAVAPRLIFEFQQTDFGLLSAKCIAVIDALAKLGFRFSLDHIDNPVIDAQKIHESGVRFIKLDASRLVGISQTPDGERMIRTLKEKMDDAEITLIVERMETERDLKELLDFEIDYGEGYLFGKPDLEIAYRRRKTA
jgi:cyclic-di-GMP phosphodiesterase TipF (flagellum assembly factor)